MKKILVFDTEDIIIEQLNAQMKQYKYRLIPVESRALLLSKIASEFPQLIIINADSYPDYIDVLYSIHARHAVPMMIIASQKKPGEIASALDYADDFICQPCDWEEAFARVRAVIRRCSNERNDAIEKNKEIKYDNLIVNLTKYELQIKGEKVSAPPKELELLFYLASNPNRVFTRDKILDDVWGFEYYGDSRTVDVHIKRLRRKLDDASSKWDLKTVWGVGYKFEITQ